MLPEFSFLPSQKFLENLEINIQNNPKMKTQGLLEMFARI